MTILKNIGIGVVVLILATTIFTTPAYTEDSIRYKGPDLITSIEGSNVLDPSEQKRIKIAVQNKGSYITGAYGDSNSFSSIDTISNPGAAVATTANFKKGNAPIEIKSGTKKIGSVQKGKSSYTTLTLETENNAKPGTYKIPVEFNYEYVYFVSSEENSYYRIIRSEETEREHIKIRIDEDFNLEIPEIKGTNLRVGEEGLISATIENAGTETIYNSKVNILQKSTLTTQDTPKSIETLEPGHTKTLKFRVSIDKKTTEGPLPISFQVKYEDKNDNIKKSDIQTAKVNLNPERTFEISGTSEDLYVNSKGAIHIKVRNNGENTVKNAKLVIKKNKPFSPVSNKASLGDIPPNDVSTASFKLDVIDQLLPQNYSIDLYVEYDNNFGEKEKSDINSIIVNVKPEMTFDILNTPKIERGSTEKIQMEVKNTAEGVYRDAVIRLNVDSPFSTDDDTAYIGNLTPDQTKNVSFKVTAENIATLKEYPVDMAIKYDNSFGDKVITDIEKISIKVTEKRGLIERFVENLFGIFSI